MDMGTVVLPVVTILRPEGLRTQKSEYYKDYRRYEEVTKTFKHNVGIVTDDK